MEFVFFVARERWLETAQHRKSQVQDSFDFSVRNAFLPWPVLAVSPVVGWGQTGGRRRLREGLMTSNIEINKGSYRGRGSCANAEGLGGPYLRR